MDQATNSKPQAPEAPKAPPFDAKAEATKIDALAATCIADDPAHSNYAQQEESALAKELAGFWGDKVKQNAVCAELENIGVQRRNNKLESFLLPQIEIKHNAKDGSVSHLLFLDPKLLKQITKLDVQSDGKTVDVYFGPENPTKTDFLIKASEALPKSKNASESTNEEKKDSTPAKKSKESKT